MNEDHDDLIQFFLLPYPPLFNHVPSTPIGIQYAIEIMVLIDQKTKEIMALINNLNIDFNINDFKDNILYFNIFLTKKLYICFSENNIFCC